MPLYKYTLILIIIFPIATSCKTISINKDSYKTTESPTSLLSIGLEENGILENGFNPTAIPLIKKPIRIMPSSVTFNKKSFKAYTNAIKNQQKDITLTYIDSIPNKPKFLSLKVIDQVELANQLNSKHNSDVKDYMSNENNASIILNTSIAFKLEDMNAITTADKVFLVQDGIKNHKLQLYLNQKQVGSIKFSEGIIFAYSASNCCWKEDNKQKLQINAFVDRLDSCPYNSYKSAQRAKKKINYFKL